MGWGDPCHHKNSGDGQVRLLWQLMVGQKSAQPLSSPSQCSATCPQVLSSPPSLDTPTEGVGQRWIFPRLYELAKINKSINHIRTENTTTSNHKTQNALLTDVTLNGNSLGFASSFLSVTRKGVLLSSSCNFMPDCPLSSCQGANGCQPFCRSAGPKSSDPNETRLCVECSNKVQQCTSVHPFEG